MHLGGVEDPEAVRELAFLAFETKPKSTAIKISEEETTAGADPEINCVGLLGCTKV